MSWRLWGSRRLNSVVVSDSVGKVTRRGPFGIDKVSSFSSLCLLVLDEGASCRSDIPRGLFLMVSPCGWPLVMEAPFCGLRGGVG